MQLTNTKTAATIERELSMTRNTMDRQDLLKQLWQIERVAQAAAEGEQ